jgi:hypothetical protein
VFRVAVISPIYFPENMLTYWTPHYNGKIRNLGSGGTDRSFSLNPLNDLYIEVLENLPLFAGENDERPVTKVTLNFLDIALDPFLHTAFVPAKRTDHTDEKSSLFHGIEYNEKKGYLQQYSFNPGVVP